MRNTLLLVLAVAVTTLLWADTIQAVSPTVANEPSIYAPRTLPPGSIPTPADDGQLLPVRGADLPLPTAAGGSVSNGPQDSVVEAIPTPTAFHTGAFLILSILAVRWVHKLRRA